MGWEAWPRARGMWAEISPDALELSVTVVKGHFFFQGLNFLN